MVDFGPACGVQNIKGHWLGGVLASVAWAAAVADTPASNKVTGLSGEVMLTSNAAVLPKNQLGSFYQDVPNPIMARDHISTILAGKNKEEHLATVEEVLKRLQNEGIDANGIHATGEKLDRRFDGPSTQ
eukprot:Em0011g698a